MIISRVENKRHLVSAQKTYGLYGGGPGTVVKAVCLKVPAWKVADHGFELKRNKMFLSRSVIKIG